ncbi:hypothetical protein EAW94_24065 [Salmonella enterica]|nr:hypothetical protein [Salmonella enterica]
MRKQQAATLLLSVWLWSGDGVAWAQEAPVVPSGGNLLGDDQSRTQDPADGQPRVGFAGARLYLHSPSGETLIWRSDEPGVAAVDDTGQVTLHQPGETVIRDGNAAGEATLALAVQTWWSALPVRPEGYTWDALSSAGRGVAHAGELVGERTDRAPSPASLWGEGRLSGRRTTCCGLPTSRTSGTHAVVRLRDGTTGEMSDNLQAGGLCVM